MPLVLCSKFGVLLIVVLVVIFAITGTVVAPAIIKHFQKVSVTPTFDNVQYDFMFYCPVTYMMKMFAQNVIYLLYSLNSYNTRPSMLTA